MTSDEEAAKFKQMVDAAVMRLVRLPDDQVVEQLKEIVAAFEQVLRDAWPDMSAANVETLRDHFLADIGRQLKSLSTATGSA